MAAALLRLLPFLLLALTAPPATAAAAVLTPAAAKNVTLDSATLSFADLTLLGDSFLRNGSVGLTRETGVPSSSAGTVLCTQPVAFRGPGATASNATAVASFAATYKNLTAKAKTAILLYHAVPDYFSLQLLKSNNGMVTTLATASEKKMDYSYDVKNKDETVTLQTRVVTSSVTATVGDMEPLAVYAVDKFLQPKELFKVVEAPAPAPEPSSKKKKAGRGGGDDDDDSSDDSTADAEKGDAAPALLARWVVTAAAAAVAAYALI